MLNKAHTAAIYIAFDVILLKDDRGENNYDDAEAILVLPVIESCPTFALTDQTPSVIYEEDKNCTGL